MGCIRSSVSESSSGGEGKESGDDPQKQQSEEILPINDPSSPEFVSQIKYPSFGKIYLLRTESPTTAPTAAPTSPSVQQSGAKNPPSRFCVKAVHRSAPIATAMATTAFLLSFLLF